MGKTSKKQAPKAGKHGGKRPGAGRKQISKDGPAKIVAVTLPPELLAKAEAIRAAKQWSRSRMVAEALRLLISRTK